MSKINLNISQNDLTQGKLTVLKSYKNKLNLSLKWLETQLRATILSFHPVYISNIYIFIIINIII